MYIPNNAPPQVIAKKTEKVTTSHILHWILYFLINANLAIIFAQSSTLTDKLNLAYQVIYGTVFAISLVYIILSCIHKFNPFNLNKYLLISMIVFFFSIIYRL